jgi:hypothetical protein
MRFNSLLRSLGNASSVVKFPYTESKHVRLYDEHSQNKRGAGICCSARKGPGQVTGSRLLGMWSGAKGQLPITPFIASWSSHDTGIRW